MVNVDIIVLWGITCVCQGLVTNFSGFATARWFLGLFEAGLFPGQYHHPV